MAASDAAGGNLRVKLGDKTLTYSADKIIGNGSFGVVFDAYIDETGEHVAVKRVLQDRRFKNRELAIMTELDHPNVVHMVDSFKERDDKKDEVYLNLILEYIPDTVYRVCRNYHRAKAMPPMIAVKLYMYQMCRSLAYIHALGICHRDIKPQNLLVDPARHILKLCDFGSAKRLVKGEPNVAYICSRYYRAPELIFGATHYTTAIDVWSTGCVFVEMLIGAPLFPGDSGVDQLVEIIKILGTPTREEIMAMNPSYTEFKFPQLKAKSWTEVLKPSIPTDCVDLISRMLQYVPTSRITAFDACAHPFFDELRDPATKLPDGSPLPPLFNFSADELAVNPSLAEKLIPAHARDEEVMKTFAKLGLKG